MASYPSRLVKILLTCSYLIAIWCTTQYQYQRRWAWKKKPVGEYIKSKDFTIPNDKDACEEYNAYFTENTNMSPPLRSTLKSYEQVILGVSNSTRDASLTNALHRYINRLEDIREKILVFRVESPTLGLGNRILGLMSSFLLALLTDRIFLVDFDGYSVDDLFCSPFDGVSWTFTGSWSKISSTFKGPTLHAEDVDHLSGMYGKLAVLRITEREEDEPAAWSLAMGGDLMRQWSNVQIIQVRSNQYFIPLLFGNPHYRQRLQSWFPNGEVAAVLGRYLLRPRPFIWRQVEQNIRTSHGNALGLQIRSFGGNGDIGELIQGALTCLHNLESTNNPQIFVASLHPEVSERIRRERPTWNVTHPYADKVQQPGLPQAIRALQDIVMLVLGKGHLIVSPRSTLGYVASALRRRSSWYLSRTDQACNLAASCEPCFHGAVNKGVAWKNFFPNQRINITLADGLIEERGLFMQCEDTDGYKLSNFTRYIYKEKLGF